MALVYKEYVAGETVITSANMNDIQQNIINCCGYTTCTTGASTVAKTASLTNFILTTGAKIAVKFSHTNTASSPTLNVNSTGAKPIRRYGTTAAGTNPSTSWGDGEIVELIYDGSSWLMTKGTIDNMASIIYSDLGAF